MYDLIIAINVSSSKKNGFVVIETYYTKQVIVNKSGKYKGSSITPADVLNCIPINNGNNNTIKKLFIKFCFQLSMNSFYISVDNLKQLNNKIQGQQMLFMDNTDKSLVLINTIIDIPQKKKSKYQYSIGCFNFLYCGDTILSIEQKKPEEDIIRQIKPASRLYYDKKEKVYSLFFDYAGIKVSYLDKKISVMVNDIIYLRNFKFETEVRDKLLKENFVKLAKCRFIYSGRNNKQSLKGALSQVGIMMEDDDNIVIPKIKLTRGESGWFDIDLNCDLNGDIFDLASRMDLFFSKNEIEINDKKFLLPDSIIEAKDDIVIDGNKLKISQNKIFPLLRIIYDSGSAITDFFSYADVKLNLPKTVTKTAFSYQIDGIKWLKFLFLNRLGGCLADDMGLGKTFQIISFLGDADVKKKLCKVLIVVPKSLLTNWKKEFEKFSSDYRVGIYHGDNCNKFDFNSHDVIITTYNTAHLNLEKLNQIGYSLAVFDEIQMIKNHKSITSDSMKQIKADIKFGLSGTPMENSISELWNVMDILNPGVFSSHASFMMRYSGRNYNELKEILNLFIMRRMKKDVLKELPAKSEQIIYCDMGQEQKKLYTSINISVKNTIMSMKAFAAPVVLKGLTLLRECCCHPLLLDKSINVDNIKESCKLDTLKILVSNLFKSGHKILIFSNYTSMLQIIKHEFENSYTYKNSVFYLDGKVKNRNELVNNFENSKTGIFLISIKAGGVGLNLVSAQDVIIYDPWWNPFVEQQAIDRAYRIGQEKAVTVYKLVTANTLEEKIVDMQKNKEQDFDELINGISTNKNMDLNKILRLI